MCSALWWRCCKETHLINVPLPGPCCAHYKSVVRARVNATSCFGAWLSMKLAGRLTGSALCVCGEWFAEGHILGARGMAAEAPAAVLVFVFCHRGTPRHT